jgi:holo-[acyl-carrier protein] synthase
LNIYLGTDLVYVPRIQTALDRFGDRFLRKVYTPAEQKDCGQISFARSTKGKMGRMSSHQLAGRWAAKEAVVKALGTGLRYTEVEIQRSDTGAPKLLLYGAAAALASAWGNCQWRLSLSHDGDYCTATAIALCTPLATTFAATDSETKI